MEPLKPTWLDSLEIAKKVWKKPEYKGNHKLKSIARLLGIKLENHHTALEDAIAAGKIVVEVCNKTESSIENWVKIVKPPSRGKGQRSSTPTSKGQSKKVRLPLEGKPDSPFSGETLVYTDDLSDLLSESLPKIASEFGFNVEKNVTKKTTMLIQGKRGSQYKGKSKNRKKAEEYREKYGKPCIILEEKEFLDKLNKAYDILPDEKKEILSKTHQEIEEIEDLIKIGSQEQNKELPKALAKNLNCVLEKIKHYRNQLKIESFEDDDIDEKIDNLQDILYWYDFMEDAFTLAEFSEDFSKDIDNSIAFIESRLEEGLLPQPIKDYGNSTIAELEKIKKMLHAPAPK